MGFRTKSGGGGAIVANAGPWDYYLYPAGGGNYTIIHGTDGSSASSTDPGALIQTAITALGAAGGTILFQTGTYTATNTVFKLPVNLTGGLAIKGFGYGECRWVLSVSAPRFWDIARTADYQSLQDILIDNITVDATNLSGAQSANSGYQHVFGGAYITGSQASGVRMNFRRLTFTNIHVVNVPTNGTGTLTATDQHRCVLYLVSAQATVSEGTQNVVEDILIENCRAEGGDIGWVVAGVNTTGAANANGLMQRCRIVNSYHDCVTAPPNVGNTTPVPSSNFQVGSHYQLKSCYLDGLYGRYSRDVGIEIDNGENVHCTNFEFEDSYNTGVLIVSFVALSNFDASYTKISNGSIRRVNLTTHGRGITIDAVSTGQSMNKVIVDNVQWNRRDAGVVGVYGTNYDGAMLVQGNSTAGLRYLEIRNCDFAMESPVTNSAVVTWAVPMVSINMNVGNLGTKYATRISGRNNFIRLKPTNTNNMTIAAVWTIGDMVFDSFQFAVEEAANMSASGNLRCMAYGPHGQYTSTTNNQRGKVDVDIVATTATNGGTHYFTTGMTQNPFFLGGDMSAAAYTNDIRFSPSGVDDQPFAVFAQGAKLKGSVTTVAITPTASPFTWQNLSHHNGVATFGASAGTITAMDVSGDGTTFTAITWTGVGGGTVEVPAGRKVKVTYTGTLTGAFAPSGMMD